MTAPVRTAAVPDSVGILAEFVEASVFEPAEVHMAATVARLEPDTPAEVLLAVALAARGPRLGHVCVVLDDVADSVQPEPSASGGEPTDALSWPEVHRWAELLGSTPSVVATPADAEQLPLRPLVWDGERLYLQRYWTHEEAVARSLLQRAAGGGSGLASLATATQLTEVLERHFGAGDALQARAASVAISSPLSVIAGGPGTGKTTTVANLLLSAVDLAGLCGAATPRIALAAPTGKAAARMTEAVSNALGDREFPCPPATTIHRLLGAVPGSGFRRSAAEPVEADLVVVDETSMVDLSLMAHLLDAVRPDATLVLVGDPNQLASVEAGTVLGDIVAAASSAGSPLADNLTVLTRVHRYGSGSAIATLAEAIRVGDPDAVIEALSAEAPRDDEGPGHGDRRSPAPEPHDGVLRLDPGDPASLDAVTAQLARRGHEIVTAARAGDGPGALEAASAVKLLAATRRGELGLYDFTDRIEAEVAALVADDGTTLRRGERWYVGKPVLITANDPIVDVSNGDVGVVVSDAGDQATGDPMVVMPSGEGTRSVLPARLGSVEPWWAMTVHKSQGSEFPEVVVSLPDHPSPILTRELLYTAVTRARRSVTILASETRIREAVEHPVARASGLLGRLR